MAACTEAKQISFVESFLGSLSKPPYLPSARKGTVRYLMLMNDKH